MSANNTIKKEQKNEYFQIFDEISEEHVGRLMEIQDSSETVYIYNIWFDYTRDLYNKIRLGSFLAIRNFTITERNDDTVYSILKIVKKMPTHYAMIQNLNRGYPSFSEEATRSIRDSFIDQRESSIEDLTKVVVTAIPTALEFIYNDDVKTIDDFFVIPETNIPIYGEEVKILSTEAVQKIINGNFEEDQEGIVSIGNLMEDEKVNVLLDLESSLKTHFGIFGFTGVGKSNLMSTFINKIFQKTTSVHKILFFDLMDEYSGLLLDLIFSDRINGNLIYLEQNDINNYEQNFFETQNYVDNIAEIFYNQMVLPKDIKNIPKNKQKIKFAIEHLYKSQKIKVLSDQKTCYQWMNEIFDKSGISIKRPGLFRNELIKIVKSNGIKLSSLLIYDLKMKIVDILENAQSKPKVKKGSKENDDAQSKLMAIKPKKTSKKFYLSNDFEKETWMKNKQIVTSNMKRYHVYDYSQISEFCITEEEILDNIRDKTKSSLYIFISNRDPTIRKFLNTIGMAIYEDRKRTGTIEPITSLIFDESDSFIPQNDEGDDTIKSSKQIIEQYARRGRKFGLGIGLATQRVTFLDTTILGQLHTYFVSKLPRKSDRDRIQQAFSFSEEELNETFKYAKGNWLMVSHEGMGIEGVPLSIKSDNANKRIQEFLDVLP